MVHGLGDCVTALCPALAAHCLVTVLLEMGNFPNYGNFWVLLGRKNYGEFPIEIMGNFNPGIFYCKFVSK